ncbi:hypothetical protein GCM10007332_28790 [Epilithonimonas arachidiradicis]|nr:hypothetical protein GCM10007332_28790 [Epilithonimonas arachidiradicis]
MASLFFGQNLDSPDYKETKIERGSTFKKYKNGKLDSIVVMMYAVNYGNALIFARQDNEIKITNAADENSVIKIELKNKKQVRTFFYKNKPAIVVESIDFDINQLPKNTTITRSLSNNMIQNVSIKTNYEVFGDDNPDKTFKLFYGLNIRPDLDNLDSIFESIGDFFSEEDALLKLFYASYAEKLAPKALTYLKTNESGIISDGITLDYQNKNAQEINSYNIYKNGKIIKSGKATLADFQKIYQDYIIRLQE